MTAPNGDPFSLEGRVALVTGAGSGLGEAMARGLSSAGAVVVCADLDSESAARVAGYLDQKATAVSVDVRDRDAVDAMVTDAAAATGRIDVLVNSAGIGGRSRAVDYPDDLWQEVLDVNLTGSFNCCRAAGRLMISASGGSIVNIASIGGLVAFPGSVGYQTSKGGVVQMTRALAVEWAPFGVRVNAIAPGHIATAIVRRQWETEPELKEFFLTRTPSGELGKPEDLIGPVVFLASGASRMVTGHVLTVDGGYVAQ